MLPSVYSLLKFLCHLVVTEGHLYDLNILMTSELLTTWVLVEDSGGGGNYTLGAFVSVRTNIFSLKIPKTTLLLF